MKPYSSAAFVSAAISDQAQTLHYAWNALEIARNCRERSLKLEMLRDALSLSQEAIKNSTAAQLVAANACYELGKMCLYLKHPQEEILLHFENAVQYANSFAQNSRKHALSQSELRSARRLSMRSQNAIDTFLLSAQYPECFAKHPYDLSRIQSMLFAGFDQYAGKNNANIDPLIDAIEAIDELCRLEDDEPLRELNSHIHAMVRERCAFETGMSHHYLPERVLSQLTAPVPLPKAA